MQSEQAAMSSNILDIIHTFQDELTLYCIDYEPFFFHPQD